MTKKTPEPPLLDKLEDGPWPSVVSGLKRLAGAEDKPYSGMMKDLLGQLERSYETKRGYWKGGTVGVIGYGGGVIPRFTELRGEDGKPEFPEAAEFHTLRIMPAPGIAVPSPRCDCQNFCICSIRSAGAVISVALI